MCLCCQCSSGLLFVHMLSSVGGLLCEQTTGWVRVSDGVVRGFKFLSVAGVPFHFWFGSQSS